MCCATCTVYWSVLCTVQCSMQSLLFTVLWVFCWQGQWLLLYCTLHCTVLCTTLCTAYSELCVLCVVRISEWLSADRLQLLQNRKKHFENQRDKIKQQVNATASLLHTSTQLLLLLLLLHHCYRLTLWKPPIVILPDSWLGHEHVCSCWRITGKIIRTAITVTYMHTRHNAKL